MFALGFGERVVGRSQFCDYPPEAQKLPIVGGYDNPNIEAILALKPQLVIGAQGPAGPKLEQRLKTFGVETYFPPTDTFAQIIDMIRGVSSRLGATEPGDRLSNRITSHKQAIEQALTNVPKPSVLMLVGVSPLVAASGTSFLGDLISMAGGKNVLEMGPPYPSIGFGQIVALDPDVILHVAGGSPGEAFSEARWKNVRAVANQRAHVLAADVVQRPGPRVLEGLQTIATAIHPGVSLPKQQVAQ